MPIVRVTKIFYFEASHALLNYNGLCRNIHGHSYKLYVTVKGNIIEDNNQSNLGMVMDFSVLKKIVNEHIVDVFDHSFLVNKSENVDFEKFGSELFERIHYLKFQPTCENLVVHFAEVLKSKLPDGIILCKIRLHETNSSYSEWLIEDQK